MHNNTTSFGFGCKYPRILYRNSIGDSACGRSTGQTFEQPSSDGSVHNSIVHSPEGSQPLQCLESSGVPDICVISLYFIHYSCAFRATRTTGIPYKQTSSKGTLPLLEKTRSTGCISNIVLIYQIFNAL